MKDILSEIIAHKRTEIARQKQAMPTEELQRLVENALQASPSTPRSMSRALAASRSGIIAEFKRRSPSKGWIHPKADVRSITTAYEQGGATALSILTDETFFGGTWADLHMARSSIGLPILRKDFIIDPYQLWQTRLAGADAVLLIAACLTKDDCRALTDEAHALGLEVLLEIHSNDELSYVTPHVDMVGINNRNLGSFHTDVQNSFRLAEDINREIKKAGNAVLVSESGISHPDTICQLRKAGYRGFLIGETFMKASAPGDKLHSFILQINNHYETEPAH